MQNVNNIIFVDTMASLSSVLLLLSFAIGIDYMVESWPDVVTRPGNGIIYFFIFFTTLWCFLLLYNSNISKWGITKQLLIGMIVGFFISVVSVIFTSYLAFDNPVERFANSVDQHGIILVIGITIMGACWKALLLGGWLFGLMSVPFFKKLRTQIEDLNR